MTHALTTVNMEGPKLHMMVAYSYLHGPCCCPPTHTHPVDAAVYYTEGIREHCRWPHEWCCSSQQATDCVWGAVAFCVQGGGRWLHWPNGGHEPLYERRNEKAPGIREETVASSSTGQETLRCLCRVGASDLCLRRHMHHCMHKLNCYCCTVYNHFGSDSLIFHCVTVHARMHRHIVYRSF